MEHERAAVGAEASVRSKLVHKPQALAVSVPPLAEVKDTA